MREIEKVYVPSKEEFIKGIKEFEKHEKRDAMYKVANFLVSYFWRDPANMTDSLGVLLLTWNQAFYRYGMFDFDKLEGVIRKNMQVLSEYRGRNIFSFTKEDEASVSRLFNEFMDALKAPTSDMVGRKSPVAVAKALHLLAPNFFPLWDNKIARAYKCHYNKNPAEQYTRFMWIMKDFAEQVKDYIDLSRYHGKTLLKLIDEYNYAKYTKKWI